MTSSSTTRSESPLRNALASLPSPFDQRILDAYLELKRRHARARYDASWDAGGLTSGKFCEAVIRLLQKVFTGSYTRFGQHIPNFADTARTIIEAPATASPESLRVIAPRALVFIYTLRGKRGIGHAAGDVDANAIDAATIVRVCDWVICELVRVYHNLALEDAQAIVDAVSERQISDVWEVAGRKRVLRPGLTYKDKVLVLLYSELTQAVPDTTVFDWAEHSNFTAFKRDVLRPLHRERLVEYDEREDVVHLSPLGACRVQESILRDGH